MILAIDQGTTGTTCLVFNSDMHTVGRAYEEFAQHFPRPGWVEHDPVEIWQSTHRVAGRALADAGIGGEQVQAVGITNQRETVVVWDPLTGEPLHNAVVWQDRRTADRCQQLRQQGYEEVIRSRTGLVLDPYFSATKIEWLLENVDGLRSRVEQGLAVFGTVDSWLIYKLTGRHATDASNASRTMLYNIERGRWEGELLQLFGVPENVLPEVLPSCGNFGAVNAELFHGCQAPVTGVVGDQQAALFGQGCFEPGQGKNTYGTGSFVLVNAGSQPPEPVPGLLNTVAWQIADTPTYALEASIFVTGAAIQWLRDGLQVIADAAETEALAASLESNEGVYFVPALTGLGSPHWDPYARGTVVGLTRGSGRAHLARAALEAIAYQTVDAVQAIERAGDVKLPELRADGGATANGWLMQFQADMLGVPVTVAETAETTAFGAASLAAFGANLKTLGELSDLSQTRACYKPGIDRVIRARLQNQWRRALERSLGWAMPND